MVDFTHHRTKGVSMRASKIFCIFTFLLFSLNVFSQSTGNISGLYYGVLTHDEGNYKQYAKITLRTVNPEGRLKISANVRVFFGRPDSNEYLTYDYSEVPLNLLTRQLSLVDEDNDVSMIGSLKNGKIEGEWFSTLVGRVGTFVAQKGEFPKIEGDDERPIAQALSGNYRGSLSNTNPESNLPERISFSFVTTQENSDGNPTLHISGSSRFYLGEFDTLEYTEVEFDDIQFNYYNRFLTAKTKEYGLTFKGYISLDGVYEGEVFSDALGVVGDFKVEIRKRN